VFLCCVDCGGGVAGRFEDADFSIAFLDCVQRSRNVFRDELSLSSFQEFGRDDRCSVIKVRTGADK